MIHIFVFPYLWMSRKSILGSMTANPDIWGKNVQILTEHVLALTCTYSQTVTWLMTWSHILLMFLSEINQKLWRLSALTKRKLCGQVFLSVSIFSPAVSSYDPRRSINIKYWVHVQCCFFLAEKHSLESTEKMWTQARIQLWNIINQMTWCQHLTV